MRVNNLITSPVNEPFQELFEIESFLVLGNADEKLKKELEGGMLLISLTKTVLRSIILSESIMRNLIISLFLDNNSLPRQF